MIKARCPMNGDRASDLLVQLVGPTGFDSLWILWCQVVRAGVALPCRGWPGHASGPVGGVAGGLVLGGLVRSRG